MTTESTFANTTATRESKRRSGIHEGAQIPSAAWQCPVWCMISRPWNLMFGATFVGCLPLSLTQRPIFSVAPLDAESANAPVSHRIHNGLVLWSPVLRRADSAVAPGIHFSGLCGRRGFCEGLALSSPKRTSVSCQWPYGLATDVYHSNLLPAVLFRVLVSRDRVHKTSLSSGKEN